MTKKARLPIKVLLVPGLLLAAAAVPWLSRAARFDQQSSAPAPEQKQPLAVPGEILVRFRKDAVPKSARTEMSVFQNGRHLQLQIEQLSAVEIVAGLRLVRVAPEDTVFAIEALRTSPDVLYAEPNFLRYKQAVPNDPRYSEQWSLKNTFQPGADINAEQAWEITKGDRNVVVGIVDEGVDINHPDLKDNIWKNPGEVANNGIDDDNNGYVDDVNGWDFLHHDKTVFDNALGYYPPPQGYSLDVDDHGTHIAGTIGATGNNSLGIAGINWQVSLLPLKFLGPTGGTSANLVEAFAYAKMMRDRWVNSGGSTGANIRVLNNSYGSIKPSQAELDAIRALNSSGILFVAAAGNNGTDNDRMAVYPANYDSPNVISVAMTSPTDEFGPNFTNFGALTVDVGAPGWNILSTTPYQTYTTALGTSMAAAHVTGIAALACAAYPDVSLEHLRSAVLFGGDIKPTLLGKTITGRRVNARLALQSIAENDATAPAAVGGLSVFNQSGRTTTLHFSVPGDDGNTGRASLYEVRYSDADISSTEGFAGARPLAVSVLPGSVNTAESLNISIPYRHLAGFVAIRAVDNAGNAGQIAKVQVSVDSSAADPYLVLESAASPLSTGGTLVARGDDLLVNTSLPFSFPFFGNEYTFLGASTNGTLYLGTDIGFPGGPRGDSVSSAYTLNGLRMIAGLWDDLRTDRNAGDGLYLVKPDQNRVIFRWQAVTRNGELPVNFEIELQRNGSILMRYGAGNGGIFPIVGISAGARDAYLVSSHSSEELAKDLGNAATVTFTPRNPPTADVRVNVAANPTPVAVGQQLTYTITVANLGPVDALQVNLSAALPAGTTFLSCSVSGYFPGICSAPAVGTNGTVTIDIPAMGRPFGFPDSTTVKLAVLVNASAGSVLHNTITTTTYTLDPDHANDLIITDTPVFQDTGLAGVKSVSAGYSFALAVLNDNTVLAWGSNWRGQLGDGTTIDRARPVQVIGLTDIIAVSAGYDHSMALRSDGTVWTWGFNQFGQLGNGDAAVEMSTMPLKVPGLPTIQAISAGASYSLALQSDGSVWAWGSDDYGRLGGAPNPYRVFRPGRIPTISNVRAISAGGTHALALRTDGSLWGWGDPVDGALGVQSQFGYMLPAPIPGISNVTAFAASLRYSIALKGDGTVWVWGQGYNGELGDGTMTSRASPGPANISNVVAITAGMSQVFALKNDATVWGWGFNPDGSLGDGTNSTRSTPAPVQNLSGVAAIDGGAGFGLAILSDRTLRAWGNNGVGNLGDGTLVNHNSPVLVSGYLTVAAPTFSVPGGTYNVPQNVVIYCSTSGAVIHYSINGQDPTENDPAILSGMAVRLEHSAELKTRAWRPGWATSPIQSPAYTITATPNPIDDARNFVRQNYLDFLNREPDQGGWDYWTSRIAPCGIDAACIQNTRIDVSAAFFIELEFQQTGSVVYRLYRAAYGPVDGAPTRAKVTYAQFNADRALLVGGAGLPQSTMDLANNFVQRVAFKAEYPDALTPANFVDHLFEKAGLAGAANASLRQAEIEALTSNSKTRAQVLLDVIDVPEFKDREYKPSFVLMQYFGYLRRDAEAGGYDFWLNILNNHLSNDAGGYRAMVCAFITSAEYQLRFGSTLTRSDHDCQ